MREREREREARPEIASLKRKWRRKSERLKGNEIEIKGGVHQRFNSLSLRKGKREGDGKNGGARGAF